MASYASAGNNNTDASMDSLIAPPTFATARNEAKEDGEEGGGGGGGGGFYATARKEAKEDGDGDALRALENRDLLKILKHVDGGGMYRPQGVTTDTPIDKLIPPPVATPRGDGTQHMYPPPHMYSPPHDLHSPPVATPRGDGEGAYIGPESKYGIRFSVRVCVCVRMCVRERERERERERDRA